MKEWALKHPVMAFLLVSSAIEGVVRIAKFTETLLITAKIAAKNVGNTEESKEETGDEPAADIQ